MQNNQIEYTLSDVVTAGIRSRLVQMFVALPATVQSFDPETQTIEAKISINRIIIDEVFEFPILTDVPVMFPRSAAGGLSFVLAEGDEVMLHFVQRSTNNWREKGPGNVPDRGVLFDINDAVAYPCVNPVETTYILREGTEIVGEKVFIGNPEEPIALTNPKGKPTSPIECDLVQILAAMCDAFSLPLVSAMGPVNFDPQVVADFAAIKAALDKMILAE